MDKRNIVVTGCTKGIGLAIVKLFASKGFNVAGCARSKKDLDALRKNLSETYPGQSFLMEPCDASKRDDLTVFIQKVNSTFSSTDILINNMGVFTPGHLFNEEEGVLEHLLSVNVTSAYHITRGFIRGMMEKKNGYIFNMCSVASIRAYENGGSYCISKFALLGFSKQLREEMKPYGVKVTAVMPGATLTESWAGTDLPESRFIKAEDVALTIWNIYQLSSHTDVEEIIIRPQLGDI